MDIASLFFILSAKYLFIAIIGIALAYLMLQKRDVQKRMIVFAVLALPLTYLAAKILGFFFYYPRPFVTDGFTPLIAHVADNGFPSDHTLISAAIAAALWPFNKKVSIALWALTIIVGFSRIYVGVHHGVDIIGSIVIAITFAWLVQSVLEYTSVKRLS
ncbi:MAG: phosphatase PAP2 family protein [Candidatus Spechtbacteria bacterium]|nr:phosphatase PAP2 family protein [Candidatus Spechtbacteria bacterium]